MKITYKEFFEKSKTKPYLQSIFSQCLMSAIKIALIAEKTFPDRPKPDVGNLTLVGLKALCQTEGIIITGREEITAEHMSGIMNSYGCPPAEAKDSRK